MIGIVVTLLAATGSMCSANPISRSVQPSNSWRVVVNSNSDGPIQADGNLTLREAIALANGDVSVEQFSEAEQAQITPLPSNERSVITFDLPPDHTTIYLNDVLPPLDQPGLTIDGTTQPGYSAAIDESSDVLTPVVAIAPFPHATVFRGFMITADRVTIRGLSLYGFAAPNQDGANLPPADIFITQPSSPAIPQQLNTGASGATPQNVVIEENWLGMSPDGQVSRFASAFGVSVFNGVGTVIQHNRIANHSGSGIITGVQADNLIIRHNVIQNNGSSGTPDAIRLEGSVQNAQIEFNLISGNAGSGVFLFKPSGSVSIQNNQITSNGRQLNRAAIYLLGSGHQVMGNQIQDQPGSGVVVGAYPRSDRNLIQANHFAHLDGLSIDLNTQLNVGVEDFQRGDGPNPPRNSANRRLDTANGAINAPRFLSSEFLIINGRVSVDGVADPNSQIELYRVEEAGSLYGPLSEAIAKTTTDADGRFSFTLDNLQSGDRVSAIATDPRYGTSEPALNAVVHHLISSINSSATPFPGMP